MAGPGSRRFLILHGWQNRRPPSHWQWQLAEALRAEAEPVLYPQLPDPDRPSPTAWRELVRAELGQLGAGERIVIAHSLAVLVWLDLAPALTAAERVDRVLLVSPPSREVLRSHVEVAAFADIPIDPVGVGAAAATTRLVGSDDDPYCPGGADVEYAALRLDTDVLSGAGHLDTEAGYGVWPAVLAWCHDPRTRLTSRAEHGMT